MTFREHDVVVLTRDVPEHGLRRGDVGTIVHLHSHDAFEVEFISASGRTHAVITLTAADVRAAGKRAAPGVCFGEILGSSSARA